MLTTAKIKKARARSTGKVGRRSWTTDDQDKWLKERLPSFIDAQSKKGAGKSKELSDFWSGLFESWFSKWPEPTASNNPSTADTTPGPQAENPDIQIRMKVSRVLL